MSDDDVTAADLDEALAAGEINEATHRDLMRRVEKRERKRDRWDLARIAADEDLEQGRIGPEGHKLRLREIGDAEKRHGRVQVLVALLIIIVVSYIVLTIVAQLQQASLR